MQRIILATGIHVSQWIGFKRYSVVVACLTGLALYIAHYNFSASLPKLWALPRGLWLCPKNPARTVSPMQPDQRVTLSLETPLIGFHP